jgi:hypothetical protein
MLRAVRIQTDELVEQLRQLRNICRGTYVNDNSHITKGMQRVFWKKNKDITIGFLYYDEKENLVGFGMIRKIEGKNWFSVGVHPLCTQHGYGKEITHTLINTIPGDVWSKVLNDNINGLKIHVKEDWEVVDNDSRITTFRTYKGR